MEPAWSSKPASTLAGYLKSILRSSHSLTLMTSIDVKLLTALNSGHLDSCSEFATIFCMPAACELFDNSKLKADANSMLRYMRSCLLGRSVDRKAPKSLGYR